MAGVGTVGTTSTGLKYIDTDLPGRLDALPFSRYHLFLVCALGISWILDGIEVSIAAVLAPVLEDSRTLGISHTDIGLLGAVYIVGTVTGSLFFGRLTDLYGRKKLYLVTPTVYVIGTALCSLAPTFPILMAARVLTGFGIGGEYSAINSIVQEITPAANRGAATLCINCSFWLGSMLASGATIFLLDCHRIPIEYGWRTCFAVGAAIGVLVVVLRVCIPESPRWLLQHGKFEQAAEVVAGVERKAMSWGLVWGGRWKDGDHASSEPDGWGGGGQGGWAHGRQGMVGSGGGESDDDLQQSLLGAERGAAGGDYVDGKAEALVARRRGGGRGSGGGGGVDDAVVVKSPGGGSVGGGGGGLYSVQRDCSAAHTVHDSSCGVTAPPLLGYEVRRIYVTGAAKWSGILSILLRYKQRALLGLTLMIAQAFFYNAVYFTYADTLMSFFGVGADRVGLYGVPFALANLCGGVLSPLFDSIGRRRMIGFTYATAATLLMAAGGVFMLGVVESIGMTAVWGTAFFFASPAASSGYLVVSEVFPMEIRGMAISIFYSVGTAVGGISGPLLFGRLLALSLPDGGVEGDVRLCPEGVGGRAPHEAALVGGAGGIDSGAGSVGVLPLPTPSSITADLHPLPFTSPSSPPTASVALPIAPTSPSTQSTSGLPLAPSLPSPLPHLPDSHARGFPPNPLVSSAVSTGALSGEDAKHSTVTPTRVQYREFLVAGYGLAAALMYTAAAVAIVFGVDAEGQSLESLTLEPE